MTRTNTELLDVGHLLRTCGYCSGHHAGHDSRSFGGVYLCPRHLAAMFAGFDPQPNTAVRFIDGPQREYVVLALDGDVLTVRPLGRPGSPSCDTSVRCVWPDATTLNTVILLGLEARR